MGSIGAIPYLYILLYGAVVMGLGFKFHRLDEAYLVLLITIPGYVLYATLRYFLKK